MILERELVQGTPYYLLLAAHYGKYHPPLSQDRNAFLRDHNPNAAQSGAKNFWAEHVYAIGAHRVRCNRCRTILAREDIRPAIYENLVLCQHCEEKQLYRESQQDEARQRRKLARIQEQVQITEKRLASMSASGAAVFQPRIKALRARIDKLKTELAKEPAVRREWLETFQTSLAAVLRESPAAQSAR